MSMLGYEVVGDARCPGERSCECVHRGTNPPEGRIRRAVREFGSNRNNYHGLLLAAHVQGILHGK
jgi:hypothetical protein